MESIDRVGLLPPLGVAVGGVEKEAALEMLLLKVSEVAALLGVSRAKVYELMAEGSLPSVKVHRSRRIRAVDLQAFVEHLNSVA